MTFHTISVTQPFARTLARYCEDLAVQENVPLSKIKIFLPTRRAIRTLKESFLQLSNGKPCILPMMESIGDADLEEAHFANAYTTEIPPAIDGMNRQITLAKLLCRAWPDDYTMVQAMSVASDLGQLIDQIYTQNIDIHKLSEIVTDKELAEYWNITFDFLQMVLTNIWPAYLSEIGMIDPGLHRSKRIQMIADFYRDNPPNSTVIIAGSTGSIPAVRQFMKILSQCDKGQIILPALDKEMSDQDWFHIDKGHPQALLKELLTSCHVDRKDVSPIGDEAQFDREFLLTEMMRPATRTDEWQGLFDSDLKTKIENGLNGITYCEADNDHHEAEIIALSMLEIAADEKQEKTAILVTPNRYLAMRVQSSLQQWGIDIDDSGGTSLMNTPIGQFALSLCQSWNGHQIYPVPFLATLKNGLIGDLDGIARTQIRRLEKTIFRGVRPYGDWDNLIGLSDKTASFLSILKEKFEPFLLCQTGRHSLRKIVTAHLQIMEALAKTNDLSGAERLWHGDAGEAMASFMTKLLSYADEFDPLSLSEYAELLQNMMARESYTAKFGKHPRLAILGQIESRMLQADRVILSGLNDGIWPPEAGFDIWMSRQMRGDFGLPSLEQKTTLAAHDFICGLGAKDVFITRSQKTDGQPTLPSRWMQRLETVLKAAKVDETLWPHQRGLIYTQWARQLRDVSDVQPISRPKPSPSIDRRPLEFSVTEIEKWMRDPYWIYAKKILNLKKLDHVDMDVTAADRGTLIHDVLDRFTRQYSTSFVPNSLNDELISIGRDVFQSDVQNPEIHGLWWPRFVKSMNWFSKHEMEWRTGTSHIHSEITGVLDMYVNGQTFQLKGKADRIEKRHDGSYVVVDYKTGQSPSSKDVNDGISSQLVLEALLIDQKAFENVNIQDNQEYGLSYWIVGGAGVGGEAKVAQGSRNAKSTDMLLKEAYDGVRSLFEVFLNDGTPYIASPDPKLRLPYNDYAHLQRISEWSVIDGGDD